LPVEVVVHFYDSTGYAENNTIKIHLVDQEGFEIEDPEENRTYHKYGEEIENFYGVFSVESRGAITPETPQTIFVEFNHLNGLAAAYSGALTVEVANKLASVVGISLL